MSDYEMLIAEMKDEFPKFELIEKKDSAFMKALDIGLKIITFWQMTTFMTKFTTTVGYKVYTPVDWDQHDRVSVLKHEAVHMRQMRRDGRVWMWFSYMFLWFPCVFAYFRKKYEQEAYEVTIRHRAKESGIRVIEHPEYREMMIKRFTSAQYFWTWPFRKSIEKWYDGVVEQLRLELTKS
jgi:hypothetical protein